MTDENRVENVELIVARDRFSKTFATTADTVVTPRLRENVIRKQNVTYLRVYAYIY